MSVAALSVLVLDRSRPLTDDDRVLVSMALGEQRETATIIAVNKVDLAPAWHDRDIESKAVEVSAATGAGLEALTCRLADALGVDAERRDPPLVTNVRHIELLRAARSALARAMDALVESNGHISEEFVLADLQEASASLQEVTGRRTTDDLLALIFSRFCIGK
jgi:tRNA modification GTPase